MQSLYLNNQFLQQLPVLLACFNCFVFQCEALGAETVLLCVHDIIAVPLISS